MFTHPLNLLFCYAPRDEELYLALEAHLVPLVREGIVTSCASRRLGAGVDVAAESERQLAHADIIVILVSADLLASDRIYDYQLRRAFEHHAAHPGEVIGVVLRPCDFKHGELAGVEMFPRDETCADGVRPLTSWDNRDAAFAAVATEIRRRAERLWSQNPREAHPIPAPLG